MLISLRIVLSNRLVRTKFVCDCIVVRRPIPKRCSMHSDVPKRSYWRRRSTMTVRRSVDELVDANETPAALHFSQQQQQQSMMTTAISSISITTIITTTIIIITIRQQLHRQRRRSSLTTERCVAIRLLRSSLASASRRPVSATSYSMLRRISCSFNRNDRLDRCRCFMSLMSLECIDG